MSRIRIQGGAIEVDADVIADGLGLATPTIVDLIRRGEITSRCERGEGEDEGRFRLTFYHKTRRFCCVIARNGDCVAT